MHLRPVFAAVLALSSSIAQAMTVDAKALARYDISYVQCEAQIPEMKGHRDEAYLSLWKAKLDDKTRGELAAARKGTIYRAEKLRVTQAAAKGVAPASSSPLSQQCRALWSEAQRATQTKR